MADSAPLLTPVRRHDADAVGELLATVTMRLRSAGVPSPAADARLLLAHVLDIGPGELEVQAMIGAPVDRAAATGLDALVRRREDREPLQYIVGTAAFRQLELRVGPGVFVPRPETELIVDLVFDRLPRRDDPAATTAVSCATGTVVDWGTGSGAIALAVATEAPSTEVWAVEASPEAFTWARTNLTTYVADNMHLVHGDFAETALPIDGSADVLVSNPPYVPLGAIPRDPEVRLYDPEAALFAGADGLAAIRVIATRGRQLVRRGGAVILEHGEEQGASVRRILAESGWANPETRLDLTGRDRFTLAEKR